MRSTVRPRATANGIELDWNVARARGENLELELHATDAAVFRLIGYANHANMGFGYGKLAILWVLALVAVHAAIFHSPIVGKSALLAVDCISIRIR